MNFFVAILTVVFIFMIATIFLFGLGYGLGALVVLLVGHPIIFGGVSLQIIFGSIFVLVGFLRR